MRIGVLLGILLSFVAFAVPPSPTPPANGIQVYINSAFYDVAGNSAQSLIEQMKVKSPITEDGKIYFGHTQSDLRWYYEFRRTGDAFAITVASVAVDITYTLPRRVGPEVDVDRLAQEWERYLSALTEHEHGHAHYAIEEAQKLHAQLTHSRRFADAAALRRFVDAESNKALLAARTANARYDDETRHGATQGTILR